MTKQLVYLYHEDGAGAPIGYVMLEGRLPSHIRIDGILYERYGRIGSYRYIRMPEGYCVDVPKEDVTIY